MLTLPAPKHHTFSELDELFEYLKSSEESLIVRPARTSQIRIQDDGSCVVKRCETIQDRHPAEGDFNVGLWTDLSLSRFASTVLKIPVRYLYSIEDSAFAKEVFNQRVQEKGPRNNGVHVRICGIEGIVLGITSDTYAYYANSAMLEDVRSCLAEVDVDQDIIFGGSSVWNFRLDVNLVSATQSTTVNGQRYVAGLRLINSCDGSTAISVLPYLRRDEFDKELNQWQIGAVSPEKIAKMVHRGGKNFQMKLSNVLSFSSDTFRDMIAAVQRLGTVRQVSTAQWNKLHSVVGTKLGNRKMANEIFESASKGIDSFGSMYFACPNYDTECEEPISVEANGTTLLRDTRGQNPIMAAFDRQDLLNHPRFDPETQDIWVTSDFKKAYPVDSPENRVNVGTKIAKRLRHAEHQIRERDPFVPFSQLLDKAEECEHQDRRLDYEKAAGEILADFIGK